jgi:putative hemolysin
MVSLYIELSLLFILICLSALFSGSETAFFSLSSYQIEKLVHKNPKKGIKIRRLLNSPRSLIITILLGNEFVNVSISTISAGIIIHILGQETPWINIGIVLPLLLLFGEITPKTIAIYNNEKFSSFVATPLSLFKAMISPLRWLIKQISDKIVNIFVKESARKESILTEDIVKTIVEEGEKEGVLDDLEKKYIFKIFDFGDTTIDEVMTPHSNLFCLPFKMPLKEMIQKIKQSHYSKVPIYRNNRDNIIGVLFATDLIGLNKQEIEDSENTLNKILREPYFAPVNKRADELFRTFQRKKMSFAIVLDEYGGIQGLVTMEDLLEQIFGEISDEYEKEKKHHQKISPSTFKVKANMPLEKFNKLIGADIKSEEMDTIGGFLFSLFGELPKENMKIKFNNLLFTVNKITKNRIDSITVKKT